MPITLSDILTISLSVLIMLIILWSSVVNADSELDNTSHGDSTVATNVGTNKDRKIALGAMDMESKNLYEIQPQTSKIEFRVNSPVGKISVSFQDFGGHFSILKTGENKGPAAININTESLETDAGFVGMMLRGENFFDVENFPSMSFIGSSFEWVNDQHAILIGDMTIKNVTRKVAFYVQMDASDNKSSERISMTATANIRRSEFGLLSLSSVVSDTVSLYVNVDALKIGSAKTDEAITVSLLH